MKFVCPPLGTSLDFGQAARKCGQKIKGNFVLLCFVLPQVLVIGGTGHIMYVFPSTRYNTFKAGQPAGSTSSSTPVDPDAEHSTGQAALPPTSAAETPSAAVAALSSPAAPVDPDDSGPAVLDTSSN